MLDSWVGGWFSYLVDHYNCGNRFDTNYFTSFIQISVKLGLFDSYKLYICDMFLVSCGQDFTELNALVQVIHISSTAEIKPTIHFTSMKRMHMIILYLQPNLSKAAGQGTS